MPPRRPTRRGTPGHSRPCADDAAEGGSLSEKGKTRKRLRRSAPPRPDLGRSFRVRWPAGIPQAEIPSGPMTVGPPKLPPPHGSSRIPRCYCDNSSAGPPPFSCTEKIHRSGGGRNSLLLAAGRGGKVPGIGAAGGG